MCAEYETATGVHLGKVRIADVCHCTEPNCSDHKNLEQIEVLYSSIVQALRAASDETLLSKQSGQSKTQLLERYCEECT